MPAISDDLDCRGAPLEYWFFHLHTDGLAFLVDFIVRRRIGQAEVRVSLWRHLRGQVVRTSTRAWRTAGPEVHIGECAFSPDGSTGAVAGVHWDLTFAGGQSRVAPGVAMVSRLRPFDLDLVSRPRTRLHGQITVGGEIFQVSGAPGALTHYWGRRLPDRWHWISAGGFSDPDVAVEAVLMRSRLWGGRPGLTAGFLWLRRDGRERLLISPVSGLITVAGASHDYLLTARPWRPRAGTVQLRCSAAASSYNDLGEGIHQTLLGQCQVRFPVSAQPGRTPPAPSAADLVDMRAGLEYRVAGRADHALLS